MLVNHRNALPLRVNRRAQTRWRAAEEDLSIVRRVDAAYDLDQRGFARAVFSQERVNLVWPEGDRDVSQSHNAWEALGDSTELDERRGVAHTLVIGLAAGLPIIS
jgi:hypothetical protein